MSHTGQLELELEFKCWSKEMALKYVMITIWMSGNAGMGYDAASGLLEEIVAASFYFLESSRLHCVVHSWMINEHSRYFHIFSKFSSTIQTP